MTFTSRQHFSAKSGLRFAVLLLGSSMVWLSNAALPAGANAAQIFSPTPTNIGPSDAIAIEQLLGQQWERLSEGAANTFASNQPAGEALLVAYILNRLNHGQADEARAIAEQLNQRYPDNLDGWLLNAWTNTLVDNFDSALVNMRSLKQRFDQQTDLSLANQKKLYQRLGKLIGYLQGPVSTTVNEELRDDTIAKLSAGIDAAVLQTFDNSRKEVLEQFSALQELQAEKTAEELEKVKIADANEAKLLAQQNEELEKSRERLGPERARIEQLANEQVYALQEQGQNLQQELNRISAQISGVENDLQLMYFDLNFILNQPPRFRPTTFFLENNIRSAQFSLIGLRNNGAQVSSQLAGVQQQIAGVRNAASQQLANLDRTAKKLENSRRRNMNKLAKIAQGPEIASGRKSAMKNRAVSLRTYDDLPLVLYRQQMLDQLSQ